MAGSGQHHDLVRALVRPLKKNMYVRTSTSHIFHCYYYYDDDYYYDYYCC